MIPLLIKERMNEDNDGESDVDKGWGEKGRRKKEKRVFLTRVAFHFARDTTVSHIDTSKDSIEVFKLFDTNKLHAKGDREGKKVRGREKKVEREKEDRRKKKEKSEENGVEKRKKRLENLSSRTTQHQTLTLRVLNFEGPKSPQIDLNQIKQGSLRAYLI